MSRPFCPRSFTASTGGLPTFAALFTACSQSFVRNVKVLYDFTSSATWTRSSQSGVSRPVGPLRSPPSSRHFSRSMRFHVLSAIVVRAHPICLHVHEPPRQDEHDQDEDHHEPCLSSGDDLICRGVCVSRRRVDYAWHPARALSMNSYKNRDRPSGTLTMTPSS